MTKALSDKERILSLLEGRATPENREVIEALIQDYGNVKNCDLWEQVRKGADPWGWLSWAAFGGAPRNMLCGLDAFKSMAKKGVEFLDQGGLDTCPVEDLENVCSLLDTSGLASRALTGLSFKDASKSYLCGKIHMRLTGHMMHSQDSSRIADIQWFEGAVSEMDPPTLNRALRGVCGWFSHEETDPEDIAMVTYRRNGQGVIGRLRPSGEFCLDLIKLLVKNGADVREPNSKGQRPLRLMNRSSLPGAREILSALMDLGASPEDILDSRSLEEIVREDFRTEFILRKKARDEAVVLGSESREPSKTKKRKL